MMATMKLGPFGGLGGPALSASREFPRFLGAAIRRFLWLFFRAKSNYVASDVRQTATAFLLEADHECIELANGPVEW